MATAVTQAQGLAPLIMSEGSSITYSRKYCSWWQVSAETAPEHVHQGRFYTCPCECKAPWAQRHERSYSIAEELHGNAGIKTYLGIFVSKNTSPNHLQITFPAAYFSVRPVACASGCVERNMYRVLLEGLGNI